MRQNVKQDVLRRDDYTCQYCRKKFAAADLTIDHLIPMAHGGLDEITNYATCCEPCNQRKADMPLQDFAKTIGVEVKDLPVHGDPIIDNNDLPIQIRLLRKSIFDKERERKFATGSGFQKKLEKIYRRTFWSTPIGVALESEIPSLPGHVRIMIPEIRTIATSKEEYLLLVELAKSASTRNLIGTTLTAGADVINIVASMKERHGEEAVRKRLQQAWTRYQKELERLATRA